MEPISKNIRIVFISLITCIGAYAQVVFNEIMYHPPSHNTLDEYIELLNTTDEWISLDGWRLEGGINFIFTNVWISPKGYLVICADLDVFKSIYPKVTNVVGNWQGILSNSSDRLRLINKAGDIVDEVKYADEGDWATRELGPIDYGHRGLIWHSEADGEGSSLECINPFMPRNTGQNWKPSTIFLGTPGGPNSISTNDIPPLILEIQHRPVIPASGKPIVVQAKVIDEYPILKEVKLWYRLEGSSEEFTQVIMNDDGIVPDPIAQDRIFTCEIPGQANGTIVEFYITAEDLGGKIRIWPSPVWVDDHWEQRANGIILIDDYVYTGKLPLYYIIIKRADREELRQINRNNPAPPYQTSDQTRSHAQFNATFISYQNGKWEVRYLVSVRNRGNAARHRWPQSLRVNFRTDEPWNDRVAINLNSWYPHLQLLGSVLYRHAGLPCQESWPVQVRINDTFLAEPGAPSFGFTVCNEVLDSYFAERQFPLDPGGNIYRCIRLYGNGPDLHYEGEDPALYKRNYFKQTNTALDQWDDLIHLTYILDQAPDEVYVEEVLKALDIDEWMLYFALETLVVNMETNLANANNGDGRADDYFLYFGKLDPRARVLPYDLDTILGEGDTRGSVNASLFRMCANPILKRLVLNPQFLPIYYKQLRRLTETTFEEETFSQIVELFLKELVSPEIIARIKGFVTNRVAYVRSQIPERLTFTTEFPKVDSIYTSTNKLIDLEGFADPTITTVVKCENELGYFAAKWDLQSCKWSVNRLELLPGMNVINVCSYDKNGKGIFTNSIWISYDNGLRVSHGGILSKDEIWKPEDGYHRLTNSIRITPGITLTIAPGSIIELGSGVSLFVESGGKLIANGTPLRPIIFTRVPDQRSWGHIVIEGQAQIKYAWLQHNSETAIEVNGGDLALDSTLFGTSNYRYLDLNNASFVVSRCHFPDVNGEFEPIHGTGGIKAGGIGLFYQCYFGRTVGYNDTIDFTGGKRNTGSIIHFIDNVFAGSGDDLIDIDGTDAWIEHNIFLHAHRNGSPDSSSAVSGGSYAGTVSYVTIYRNLIFDCDHAATAKQGNYYSLLYNTIVRITKEGGVDTQAAVVNLADEGTTLGQGFYLEGNVIQDVEGLLRNDLPTSGRSIWVGNILSSTWSGLGSNNTVRTYFFKKKPTLFETFFTNWSSAQILWSWFAPLDGEEKWGASIVSGPHAPMIRWGNKSLMRDNAVELWIGPIITEALPWNCGFVSYCFKLNEGEWSEWISTTQPLTLSFSAPLRDTLQIVCRTDGGLDVLDPRIKATGLEPYSLALNTDTFIEGVKFSELFVATNSIMSHQFVEIVNRGSKPIDLVGYGLTRDPDIGIEYEFKNGVILEGEDYLVVWIGSLGSPIPNLSERYGKLYLVKKGLALEIVDFIEYGPQIKGLSIGVVDGTWTLCKPSPGLFNQPVPIADAKAVRINEWLTSSISWLFPEFIELYNPWPLPVNIGKFSLTDNIYGWMDRFTFPPLSFIDGKSTLVLYSNDKVLGLPFKLDAQGGLIALCSPSKEIVDIIVYGPQIPLTSQGRASATFSMIQNQTPSPGLPNYQSYLQEEVEQVVIPLMGLTNVWRYYQEGYPGDGWQEVEFNDKLWPEGLPVFGYESSRLPWPISTPLTLGQITYYFRTYFKLPQVNNLDKLQLTTLIDDGAIFYLNGQEVFRIGMEQGVVDGNTYATRTVDNATIEGPFELPVNMLRPNETNVIAVEVHQAGRTSSDIVFGICLDLIQLRRTSTFVKINEIATSPTSVSYDWIELFNPGDKPLDVAGYLISDDPLGLRYFIIRPPAIVPSKGYLLVQLNNTSTGDESSNWYDLSNEGGVIYLLAPCEWGYQLVDAVIYGIQPSQGYSLGRIPDGEETWRLTVPTPAAQNIAAVMHPFTSIRINEWLADPVEGPDWIELYNPEAGPVELSGLILTDDICKFKYRFPPLSFMGAGFSAFLVLYADEATRLGPAHLPFKLSRQGEAIVLLTPEGYIIDTVTFGTQKEGVSQGRIPDGTQNIFNLSHPTPGFPNGQLQALDSDGDNMPDVWEISYGFDPYDSTDGTMDSDSDGLNNFQEYIAGTNPLDPQSLLQISKLTVDKEKGRVCLQFKCEAGRRYYLYRARNISGPWEKVVEIPPQGEPRNLEVEVIDDLSISCFYRIGIEM